MSTGYCHTRRLIIRSRKRSSKDFTQQRLTALRSTNYHEMERTSRLNSRAWYYWSRYVPYREVVRPDWTTRVRHFDTFQGFCSAIGHTTHWRALALIFCLRVSFHKIRRASILPLLLCLNRPRRWIENIISTRLHLFRRRLLSFIWAAAIRTRLAAAIVETLYTPFVRPSIYSYGESEAMCWCYCLQVGADFPYTELLMLVCLSHLELSWGCFCLDHHPYPVTQYCLT